MAKAKKTKPSKKAFRQDIIKKLKTNFGDLSQVLGQKKFERRIKKASKVLANGLRDIPAVTKKVSQTATPQSEPVK